MKETEKDNDNWIRVIYTGKPVYVNDVLLFETGMESGLPKDIWEKSKSNLTDWKEI